MAKEIERKWLVKGDWRSFVKESVLLCQGYLTVDPGRTVRVRIRGDRGFITVKGPSSVDGLERFEWETEIAVADAEALLALCLPGKIEKRRHLAAHEGHIYEIDEFLGANSPLLLAELELASAGETFILAPFLGEEVTGDVRYYNSYLSEHPYSEW